MTWKKLLLVLSIVAVPATAWAAAKAHSDCGCSLGQKCSCGGHCGCDH